MLRYSDTGRRSNGELLLRYVDHEFPPERLPRAAGNLEPGLEAVFTHLEAADAFLSAVPAPGIKLPQPRPSRVMDALHDVVPGLLGEVVADRECEFHVALASRLTTEDVVLSLNYDCLMDAALSRHAECFAPACDAYGAPANAGTAAWTSPKSPPASGEPSVRMLKLHGSLNWAAPEIPLKLRPDPYLPVARGVVAPPIFNKPIMQEPFRSVWRAARTAIRPMRRLIAIGYSLPLADGYVRSLLRHDLPRLHQVTVVDPSADVCARYQQFFSSKHRVREIFFWESLEDFAEELA